MAQKSRSKSFGSKQKGHCFNLIHLLPDFELSHNNPFFQNFKGPFFLHKDGKLLRKFLWPEKNKNRNEKGKKFEVHFFFPSHHKFSVQKDS